MKYRKGEVVAVDPRTFAVIATYSNANTASKAYGVTREAIRQALQRGIFIKDILFFYKDVYDRLDK